MTYHLAIDIGASSGRHILGSTQNGKLHLEEIHRFENYITNLNGTFVWDIEHLVNEVKKVLPSAKKLAKYLALLLLILGALTMFCLIKTNRKLYLPYLIVTAEQIELLTKLKVSYLQKNCI